jgi:hypothetical protein
MIRVTLVISVKSEKYQEREYEERPIEKKVHFKFGFIVVGGHPRLIHFGVSLCNFGHDFFVYFQSIFQAA